MNLAAIPRIRLAELPTPLREARALSVALGGPRIFFKRDDLTGFALGGNKARKLELLLADARAKGADTLVVAGAFQSNMARMAAAAARSTGLHPVLILGGLAGESQAAQGNLLLDELLGATIHHVVREDRWQLDNVIEEVTEALKREGRRPYLIPLGGSTPLGAAAYVMGCLELHGQLCDLGTAASHVFVATGSGSTQAGLEIGARLLARPFDVVGVSVSRRREQVTEKMALLARETLDLLGCDLNLGPADFTVLDGYIGPGYGVMTSACREAICLVARTEGIFLDPVYTGKAMAGLIDQIRQGQIGADHTVVFLHTGGTPALFSYAAELAGEVRPLDSSSDQI